MITAAIAFLKSWKAYLSLALLALSFYGGMQAESWRRDSATLAAVEQQKEVVNEDAARKAVIARAYARGQAAADIRNRETINELRSELEEVRSGDCAPAPDGVVRNLNSLRGQAASSGSSAR